MISPSKVCIGVLAANVVIVLTYVNWPSGSHGPDSVQAQQPQETPPAAAAAPAAGIVDLEPVKAAVEKAAANLRLAMNRSFPPGQRKGVQEFLGKLDGTVAGLIRVVERVNVRFRDADKHHDAEEMTRLNELSDEYVAQLKALQDRIEKYAQRLETAGQTALPPGEVFPVTPPHLRTSDQTAQEFSNHLVALGLAAQCFTRPELSQPFGLIGLDLGLFQGDIENRNTFLDAVQKIAQDQSLDEETRRRLVLAVRDGKVPPKILDHLANLPANLPAGQAQADGKATLANVWKSIDEENQQDEPRPLRMLRSAMEKNEPLDDVKRTIARPDGRLYFTNRVEQARVWVLCATNPSYREQYWAGPKGLGKISIPAE